MTQTEVQEAAATAASTNTSGRVLCNARNHYFVVDGMGESGPGEAINHGEVLLSGVAACGVELVQALAKRESIPLKAVMVEITGRVDRSRPIRRDLTVINALRLRFTMKGVADQQGRQLIEGYQAACPLYGTIAAAIPDVQVELRIEP
ncbi:MULTISPECIES: OsmC family protein [unclassified Bradyrhizobium]|uniref:OsmC family protein n=1 Tax=unclassified Bradyrhizobium TaxID=2631580 RepID=UPI00247A2BF0|nr:MULTISPECIES: OsmC family protein [unclassified Bradyrhizobium]WGS18708.1 OsmC family protein [Bradyrhizobium sp. ISRA463]WGS25533.1 OsmC family protein [Bradyrhizobium sp. ISRA464]